MTTSTRIGTWAITTSFAMLAGYAVLAQSGAAKAGTVASCQAGSHQSVVECCESLVQRNGLPVWMRQTGRNCSNLAVVCRGGNGGTGPAATSRRRCWVDASNQEGGRDKPGRDGQGRRGGSNQTGSRD